MIEVLHSTAEVLRPEDVTGSVLICDPPYSPHVHQKMESSTKHGVRIRRSAGFAPLTPELRNHIAALGAQCRWSVVCCDLEGIAAWRDAFAAQRGYRYIRAIPWVRWSMPQLSGDRPPSGAEAIVIAGPKGRMRWNGPGNLTHFDERCERGNDKHTTAKPLDLMLRLVSYFSDPGETVIDPCCGRGTTILAAKLLNRHGLGVECDATEAALAQQRLVGELSERDAERYARWAAFAEREAAELVRIRAETDAIRVRKGLGPKGGK